MSEELRRGIPKAIKTGKTREYTDAEKRENDIVFENILKQYGVLKENQTIELWKNNKNNV